MIFEGRKATDANSNANSINVKQYDRIKCILGGICGKYKVGLQQIQGMKYSGCGAALPIELVMVVSCFGGLAITLPPPISSPTLFSEVSGHGGLPNTDANTDRNTSTNTETNTPNSVLGSLVDINKLARIHSHPSKQKDN